MRVTIETKNLLRLRRAFTVFVALITLGPGTVQAQLPNLAVGSRVRIEACSPPDPQGQSRLRIHVAALRHSDSATIVLLSSSGHLDTLPVFGIRKAYRSVGWRPRWKTTMKGFLLGAAAGLLVGMGLDVTERNQSGDGSGEALDTALYAASGLVMGAIAGALIGFTSGGEQWQRVELPNNPVGPC